MTNNKYYQLVKLQNGKHKRNIPGRYAENICQQN